MKSYSIGCALLATLMAVGPAAALAHEECDDEPAAVSETAKDAAETTVAIKLFQYQPGRLQVRPGTVVTWVNEDEILHTVTVDGRAGGFDAPLDGKGKKFSFRFTQAGLYSYHCDRHEHMRGEIEVR